MNSDGAAETSKQASPIPGRISCGVLNGGCAASRRLNRSWRTWQSVRRNSRGSSVGGWHTIVGRAVAISIVAGAGDVGDVVGKT